MLKFETHDALKLVQKTMLKFDPVMHLKVLKEYKMCKDVNVKHLVKKIISVYTMHWSALKM